MRSRLHSSWGSRLITGAIAMLASVVAVPSFGQLAAPVTPAAPQAPLRPDDRAEATAFPATVTARDLQVTAKGWVWQSLRTARLKFELSQDGKPLRPDATLNYETTITDAAGRTVDDASQHLNHAPWQVHLKLSIQPEERQTDYTLGRFQVPRAGKATILPVPATFKERGIIFAALIGEGTCAFRNGQRIGANTLNPQERWSTTEKGWTATWQANEPSFVWIQEVPENLEGWRSITFRGYSGSRRIPLFQLYPVMVDCWVEDDRPRTARGYLTRESYPLRARAGQWFTIEGFEVKTGYEVEFTVAPPEPNPEVGKETIVREYWIPQEVFERARHSPASTADDHHAAFRPVQFEPRQFAMYNRWDQMLVVKSSEETIAKAMKSIEATTGFKPIERPSLFQLFQACGQLPLQPFPLPLEIPLVFDSAIMAKIKAAGNRRK